MVKHYLKKACINARPWSLTIRTCDGPRPLRIYRTFGRIGPELRGRQSRSMRLSTLLWCGGWPADGN